MQALSLTFAAPDYPWAMKTGRPSKYERPTFGQRLHELRETAGLTQQQVADKLGMSQRAYSHWERRPVALRPDQLQNLAAALNLPVEELLGNGEHKKRGAGPVGKMRQLFEAASQLPRNQQEKVFAILEPFVAQHLNRQGKAA
jgi:transcriptional regulator with XRE-family HTH domain